MAQDAPDFESALEAYPIRLEHFEGPLDLLIHLIKKNEVNIYDIPIALITDQYLEYLSLMQELNLDLAGEFLVMAATLIHIKSRLLHPAPDPGARRRTGRGGPARGAGPPAARAPEVQGRGRAAARARDAAQRAVSAAPMPRWPRRRATNTSRSSRSISSACSRRSAACSSARRRARRCVLPPEQMSIEQRIEQLLERLSETEAVGLRGAVRRRQLARRADRHVPRAARDDPAEADPRVPVGQLRAHPRLQAAAAGRRAASDPRSRTGVRGAPSGQATRDEGRRTSDDASEERLMSDTHDPKN